MTRRAIALALALSSSVALAVWAASYRTTMTTYHSTDRYCLRFQSKGGRVALLYDGEPEVIGPFSEEMNFMGFRCKAYGRGGWQYIELSGPGWLIPLILSGYPVAFVVRVPLRCRRRRRRGLCVKCGYNLIGNESGVCPECGTKI